MSEYWDSLLDGLGSLLAFFYAGLPSYGVAIILLTVAVRLVLFPLTAKQARSMAAIQRLQPELKRLQARYKQDREKQREAMMALYQEHGVNPLAGCLPLLAQMPVFFALFNLLRNPENHVPVGSRLFRAFCPGSDTVAACKDAGPRGLDFLWMNLREAANTVGGAEVIPYLLLIGLVIVTGVLQSRQMSQMGKGGSQQAQLIGRIMPVFFGFISYTLPAGLVVYFFVSNLWQIGQQQVVSRHVLAEDRIRPRGDGRVTERVGGREGAGDGDGNPGDEGPVPGDSDSSGALAKRPSRSKSRKRKKRKRRR